MTEHKKKSNSSTFLMLKKPAMINQATKKIFFFSSLKKPFVKFFKFINISMLLNILHAIPLGIILKTIIFKNTRIIAELNLETFISIFFFYVLIKTILLVFSNLISNEYKHYTLYYILTHKKK